MLEGRHYFGAPRCVAGLEIVAPGKQHFRVGLGGLSKDQIVFRFYATAYSGNIERYWSCTRTKGTSPSGGSDSVPRKPIQ